MLRFLKTYTLPLSMLAGALGCVWLRHLGCLLTPLIFLMLFFTFCKVNPLDLRLHKWHWLMLLCQLLLSVGAFYALRPLNPVLAQGIMLCFIMPTATASPVIAGKLGGSIQSLTSFILLSNVATALVVPAFFPLANPAAEMTFWQASLAIMRKVTPLLMGPFLLAWLLRLAYDGLMRARRRSERFRLTGFWSALPFYLWAFSLTILMAQITWSLLHEQYSPVVLWGQALGALIACLLQFFLGKHIGQRLPSKPHGEDYKDIPVSAAVSTGDLAQVTRISAGQAFGQKNTTLGIWMAQTWLNPLAALGAAAYIIWQNIFNSWQLARAARGKRV
ncbi:MAG: transporter [Paludibacteraceae bacterium]|nr:transporter [Paludibacteraceae bacterium]